jgi:hypothetical protein
MCHHFFFLGSGAAAAAAFSLSAASKKMKVRPQISCIVAQGNIIQINAENSLPLEVSIDSSYASRMRSSRSFSAGTVDNEPVSHPTEHARSA